MLLLTLDIICVETIHLGFTRHLLVLWNVMGFWTVKWLWQWLWCKCQQSLCLFFTSEDVNCMSDYIVNFTSVVEVGFEIGKQKLKLLKCFSEFGWVFDNSWAFEKTGYLTTQGIWLLVVLDYLWVFDCSWIFEYLWVFNYSFNCSWYSTTSGYRILILKDIQILMGIRLFVGPGSLNIYGYSTAYWYSKKNWRRIASRGVGLTKRCEEREGRVKKNLTSAMYRREG